MTRPIWEGKKARACAGVVWSTPPLIARPFGAETMPDPANPTTVQEHLRELHALVQDSLKQWSLTTNTATATALAAQGNPNRLTNGTRHHSFVALPHRCLE